MTVKKTILYHPTLSVPTIIADPVWQPHLLNYFNIKRYNATTTYNKNDYVLWAHWKETEWYSDLVNDGFKLIHDHLPDHTGTSTTTNNILNLKSPNWIIANQSLLRNQNLFDGNFNYNKPDKFMLCLMNAKRDHRSLLFNNIKQYQDSSLISYADYGIFIDGDVNHDGGSGAWQTYVNPIWYTSTHFSLVAETTIVDNGFMSEKSEMQVDR